VRELEAQDVGDVAPTEGVLASAHAACEQLSKAESELRTIASQELPTYNAMLTKHGLHAVAAPKLPAAAPGC